LTVILPPKLL